MKFAHSCAIRTFCKQSSLESSTSSLSELLSLCGSQKLVPIDTRLPEEGETIVLSAKLAKESEINHLLKALLSRLAPEEKKEISDNAQNSIDENLDFFLRIEKKSWDEKKETHLTLSGDCYHLTFALAAYPRKKEAAVSLVKGVFNGPKDSAESKG